MLLARGNFIYHCRIQRKYRKTFFQSVAYYVFRQKLFFDFFKSVDFFAERIVYGCESQLPCGRVCGAGHKYVARYFVGFAHAEFGRVHKPVPIVTVEISRYVRKRAFRTASIKRLCIDGCRRFFFKACNR